MELVLQKLGWIWKKRRLIFQCGTEKNSFCIETCRITTDFDWITVSLEEAHVYCNLKLVGCLGFNLLSLCHYVTPEKGYAIHAFLFLHTHWRRNKIWSLSCERRKCDCVGHSAIVCVRSKWTQPMYCQCAYVWWDERSERRWGASFWPRAECPFITLLA